MVGWLESMQASRCGNGEPSGHPSQGLHLVDRSLHPYRPNQGIVSRSRNRPLAPTAPTAPPVVICIDSDDEDEPQHRTPSSRRPAGESQWLRKQPIKTERPDDGPWWTMSDSDHVAPICISDDEDDDSGEPAGRSKHPRYPVVVKQEQQQDAQACGTATDVQHRGPDETIQMDGPVQSAQPAQPAQPGEPSLSTLPESTLDSALEAAEAALEAALESPDELFVEPYDFSAALDDQIRPLAADDDLFSPAGTPGPTETASAADMAIGSEEANNNNYHENDPDFARLQLLFAAVDGSSSPPMTEYPAPADAAASAPIDEAAALEPLGLSLPLPLPLEPPLPELPLPAPPVESAESRGSGPVIIDVDALPDLPFSDAHADTSRDCKEDFRSPTGYPTTYIEDSTSIASFHPEPLPDIPSFDCSWPMLQAAIASDSPPRMAEAVRVARAQMNLLEQPLRDIEELIEGPGWAQRVAQLQHHASPAKREEEPVLIGVVGRTGAGKSAVLNAVLDEDRVLPTNGLRACTAVVTEVAWNTSEVEAERYRADVVFVQPDEWRRELTRLFGDAGEEAAFVVGQDDEYWNGDYGGAACTPCALDTPCAPGTPDNPGSSSSLSSPRSPPPRPASPYGRSSPPPEASVALAKLQAVFPQITSSRKLQQYPLETLLRDPRINRLLGTVRTVTAAQPESFYTQLQAYLDSSGGGMGAGGGGRRDGPGSDDADDHHHMALWPLIRVVRVYLKSDALSTGVVLVDLPGFGDSNAARDAMAERYIGRCAALWIVSPMTRAVDDREARELLGRSFRRQLMLDGAYRSLTFVCTKTDDLSVREVAESLDVEGAVGAAAEGLAAVDEQLEVEVQKLEALTQQQSEAMVATEGLMDRLKALEEAGVEVHRGRKQRKRRKRWERTGPEKRARRSCESEPGEAREARTDSGEADSNGDDDEAQGEERCREMETLMGQREEALCQMATLYGERERVRQSCEQLEQKRSELASERVAVCMQLRNTYARQHIQRDFAQGQRDLNFHDIAELPIFCVSSRAYQRFRGRRDTDDADSLGSRAGPSAIPTATATTSAATTGYRHIGETEIPQLQKHARQLGTECLARRDRKVLADFAQLLTSLAVWVTSSAGGFGRQIHLDQERRGYEIRHLDQAYDELKYNLTNAASQYIAHLRRIMETEILMKQSQLLTRCADAAPKTVASWSASRRDGGLLFNSYRSICRNGGMRSTAKTRRDFNHDLLKPLLDAAPALWDSAFSSLVPSAMQESLAVADQFIEHFHRRMRDRPLLRLGSQNAGLGMLLEHEIRGVKRFVAETLQLARHHLDVFRHDANRLPLDCVQSIMDPVYRTCSQESGTGCLGRMRMLMTDHVESSRHTMFAGIDTAARERLAAFSDGVLKEMLVGNHDFLLSLYHDCRNMIVGVQVPATTHSARNFVHQLLQQADAAFAPEALYTTA